MRLVSLRKKDVLTILAGAKAYNRKRNYKSGFLIELGTYFTKPCFHGRRKNGKVINF